MVIFSMQASLANRYIQIWMHLVSVFCTSPNEDFWCYRFGCTRWYALGLPNFGETLYSDFLSLRMDPCIPHLKCWTLIIKVLKVLSVLPRNALPLLNFEQWSYNCSAHSFLIVQGSDFKSDPWVLSFSHPKYALLDVPKFGHIYQILGTKKSPPV